MIKRSFLLPLFLLSALLLSACQSSDSPEMPDPVDLNPALGEFPVKVMDCGVLNHDFYREACQEQVSILAGQILAEEVLKTFDLDRCEELSYDRIEQCKSNLQASGVRGPISLEQEEALKKALQPVFAEVSEDVLENPEPEEPEMIPLNYDEALCQEFPESNGLRAYCESQMEEKREMEQLRQVLFLGESTDCSLFKLSRVQQECESLLGPGLSEEFL